MPEPRLSVIIPTHNRQALLLKTLASLERVQAAPGEFEVIVVDDGSTDGTAAVLKARTFAVPVRVIRHDRPQGPAAARNHGAREARGEILGFVDSDVIVDPAWWEQAAPHFQDPDVGAVEGAVVPDTQVRPGVFAHVVSNHKGNAFLTCNIFYRRALFRRLGGFDERFADPHSREDTDLAFRVLAAGPRIVFEPASRVRHPIEPGGVRHFFRQRTRLAVHEALLRRKHPVLYRRRLKWMDGREMPVFFWGMFAGLPLAAAGMIWSHSGLLVAGASLFGSGYFLALAWTLRKKRPTVLDLLRLVILMALIPWVRLIWWLRGEWRYRRVRPEAR